MRAPAAMAARMCSGFGGGVAEGDDDAAGREILDQRDRTRNFRGQRHQFHPAMGDVLPAAKFVPVRRPHVLAGMSAAGAVLRRNVRPFQMDAGNGVGEVAVLGTRLIDGRQAVGDGREGFGDERGKELGDAMLAAHGSDMLDGLGRQFGGSEVVPLAAVDLRIEEARGRSNRPGDPKRPRPAA